MQVKNNNLCKPVLKLFTALLLFSIYFNGLFYDVQYGDMNYYYHYMKHYSHHYIFSMFLNIMGWILVSIVFYKRKGKGTDYLKLKKSILSLDICIVSLPLLLFGFVFKLNLNEWYSHIVQSGIFYFMLLYLFDTIENS
jgi:hypothetical protein